MAYDHNKKAGNEGDIVKHPVLLAVINELCMQIDRKHFQYVDVFAGYSFNPIASENEWRQGIGKIHRSKEQVSDRFLKKYFDWYLSRPQLLGGIYPGSSTIAYDTIVNRNKVPRLTLYDVSDKVIDNLLLSYSKTNVEIYNRAAVSEDNVIHEADLLFIDPPGIYSRQKKDYPRIEELVQIGDAADRWNVLIWLPVTVSTATTPPSESKTSLEAIKYLVKTGYDVTKVLWATGGRVMGCFMAYKLPGNAEAAMRSTVENVVNLMNWNQKTSDPLTHINAFSL